MNSPITENRIVYSWSDVSASYIVNCRQCSKHSVKNRCLNTQHCHPRIIDVSSQNKVKFKQYRSNMNLILAFLQFRPTQPYARFTKLVRKLYGERTAADTGECQKPGGGAMYDMVLPKNAVVNDRPRPNQ